MCVVITTYIFPIYLVIKYKLMMVTILHPYYPQCTHCHVYLTKKG